MKIVVAILKNTLLPQLEKENQFAVSNIPESFWELLATSLYNFETDAKPVYAAIYSLELNNPEKVIKKLDVVYQTFINDLAENYVLGHSSEVFNGLLQSENQIFVAKVHFFRDLEKVIKKSERKRLKAELPTSYEKLTFAISDTEMATTLKKKGREDLKKKMKAWDEELEEVVVESVSSTNLNQNKQSKVISLYWVKYAVAASFVLGLGVWFYTNQNQGTRPDTNVVTSPDIETKPNKTDIITTIPNEVLAEVSTVSTYLEVNENTGLGYTSDTKKISLIVKYQQARISSIVKAIEKYRKDMDSDLEGRQAGIEPLSKVLKSRIDSLQNELNILKEREKQYLFDGKALTIYVSESSDDNFILLYQDYYYLKKETDFYILKVSRQMQPYKKVSDTALVNELNKILFDNGN